MNRIPRRSCRWMPEEDALICNPPAELRHLPGRMHPGKLDHRALAVYLGRTTNAVDKRARHLYRERAKGSA